MPNPKKTPDINPARTLIDRCASIRFGDLPAGEGADFYSRLNGQVTSLCRSLPREAQAEALIFLMEYSRIRVGEPLDFFRFYYRPAWSILHCLIGGRSDEEVDMALGAQAMAMLLHSLDDHLVDGDVPVSHLALMIRGQAWLRMNECVERFCADLPGGIDIARGLAGEYYGGITEQEDPPSLDAYCGLFRKQMATWVIMPVLAARKTGGDAAFVDGVKSLYESFGVAWRLLDDLQDLGDDIEKGSHSAVYTCLDGRGRSLWDGLPRGGTDNSRPDAGLLIAHIEMQGIPGIIAGRIITELDAAAGTADRLGLQGLSAEFRALAAPVASWLAV